MSPHFSHRHSIIALDTPWFVNLRRGGWTSYVVSNPSHFSLEAWERKSTWHRPLHVRCEWPSVWSDDFAERELYPSNAERRPTLLKRNQLPLVRKTDQVHREERQLWTLVSLIYAFCLSAFLYCFAVSIVTSLHISLGNTIYPIFGKVLQNAYSSIHRKWIVKQKKVFCLLCNRLPGVIQQWKVFSHQ